MLGDLVLNRGHNFRVRITDAHGAVTAEAIEEFSALRIVDNAAVRFGFGGIEADKFHHRRARGIEEIFVIGDDGFVIGKGVLGSTHEASFYSKRRNGSTPAVSTSGINKPH